MTGPDRRDMSRRRFLAETGLIGCSLAAAPIITPVTLAAAPTDNRLVVIVLRGALDGLDLCRPVFDRNYAQWRPGPRDGLPMDGGFDLHPSLPGLHGLWQAGELAIHHAVSTPYRDKRSHFDGQDFLEHGGAAEDGRLDGASDGWLNRLLPHIGATSSETAYAVGRERLLLLDGANPAMAWSPDAEMDLSAQGKLLLDLIYKNDPLFREAAIKAAEISEDMAGDMAGGMSPGKASRAEALAAFSADRLRGETRIAAFSINGFDTHRTQARQLRRVLGELETAILTLKAQLGPVWSQTAVLAMTEFGRTVYFNGSDGTDHGTGGAVLLAGGAVKGGQVVADWPGLAEVDLYARRDLMPTQDLRAIAAWTIRGLFGTDADVLARDVFPSVDMGPDPNLIL